MSTTRDLDQVTYRRLGILLVVMGGVLAAASQLEMSFVYKLWPALTLSLGIGFIGIYVKRQGRGGFFLALGEYLVLFSGLAFYLNFTSWGELGRLWPLFMAFLSIVFGTIFVVGRRRKIALFMALLMLVATVFSFLVLELGTQYWWTAFILAGISVLALGKSK